MLMELPGWSEDESGDGRTVQRCEDDLNPLRDGMAEG